MWEDWSFPIFLVQKAAATNMYATTDSEVRPSARHYTPSPDLHPPVQPFQPDYVRPAR